MVSRGTLLHNPKSNWLIANCHHNFHLDVIIARHSCHRCVYLLVTVFFAVVACTIAFFVQTYLLSSFLFIFLWLCKIFDHVIFRSTSKAFPRCMFRLSIVQNIKRASFFLFLSYPFEAFSEEWFVPPQNVHFVWTACALSLFLTKPELLSRFRWSVCSDEIFNVIYL